MTGTGGTVLQSFCQCVKRPSHPPLVGQAILQPATQRCVNAKILPPFPVNANHHPPILPSSHPPILPSSLPPILPSSLPPILPSSHPPILPSSILPSSHPPILPSSHPPFLPSSLPPIFHPPFLLSSLPQKKKEGRQSAEKRSFFGGWCAFGTRNAERRKAKRKQKKKAASQRKGAAFSVAGVPSGRGSNCYGAVRFWGRVEQVGS